MAEGSKSLLRIENPRILHPLEQWTDGALEDRVYFTPSFLPCGKTGKFQIRRCQGFAVDLLRLHPWRLGSETLRPLQRQGKNRTIG
jgi:hypothetical protein